MTTDRDPVIPENDGAPEYETEYLVEYVDNSRTRRTLVVVIVILVLLLGALGWVIASTFSPLGKPDPASLPEGVSWIRSIYTWGPSPDQLLSAPVDVDVAPNGDIWVSSNTNMLIAFNPEGRVQHVIAPELGSGPGQAASYEGIAVDEQGNVYACDYGKNTVVRYSPDGEILAEWSVQLPLEVAVRDGIVAVAAAGGVALFDEDGDLVIQWGQRGREEGDFDLPHGIAIGEDGTIYVSDSQNTRVKAYSPDGRLLWTKGSENRQDLAPAIESTETIGGVKQNMQLPLGMTFDGAGRLFVADAFEFQLIALDTDEDGLIIDRYGDFGATDGMFAYPTGVSYDEARDWFVVADTANDRVQIIRLPGSGGNAVSRVLNRALDRALWLCAIPLLVLLAVIVLGVRRRRRVTESQE